MNSCKSISFPLKKIDFYKIKGVLGLAYRAGFLICGQDTIKRYLLNKKRNTKDIIFITEDISLNITNFLRRFARYKGYILFLKGCDSFRLGALLGRKPLKIVLLPGDSPFVEKVFSLLSGGDVD